MKITYKYGKNKKPTTVFVPTFKVADVLFAMKKMKKVKILAVL